MTLMHKDTRTRLLNALLNTDQTSLDADNIASVFSVSQRTVYRILKLHKYTGFASNINAAKRGPESKISATAMSVTQHKSQWPVLSNLSTSLELIQILAYLTNT
jgi:transposase